MNIIHGGYDHNENMEKEASYYHTVYNSRGSIFCDLRLDYCKQTELRGEKILAAFDQRCKDIGICEIDLAEVFTAFEWDTVSIFVDGDMRQVYDELGVESDAADGGIVFSKDKKTVKIDLCGCQFPEDVPARIDYYFNRKSLDDPCYVTLPHDHAIVIVEKNKFRGNYYYKLYLNDDWQIPKAQWIQLDDHSTSTMFLLGGTQCRPLTKSKGPSRQFEADNMVVSMCLP